MDQGDGGAARALVGEQVREEPADSASPPVEQVDSDVEEAVSGHVAAADPHGHRQDARYGDREPAGVEGSHDARAAARGRRGGRAAPGAARGPALDGEILARLLLVQGPESEPARGGRRRRRHDHCRLSPPDTPTALPEP